MPEDDYIIIDDSFVWNNPDENAIEINGAFNATIMIYGGEFNLNDGQYIIDANPGGIVAYICGPITVNGVELNSAADWAPYFNNCLASRMY